jgi:hypothetical protein
MNRLRTFLLIVLALLLPLQTASSWAMPLCSHAAMAQEVLQVDMPCHEHAEVAVPVSTQADHECDNCGICHLASSGFLLAMGSPDLLLPAMNILVPVQRPVTQSHIGEPPQQPPRRLN